MSLSARRNENCLENERKAFTLGFPSAPGVPLSKKVNQAIDGSEKARPKKEWDVASHPCKYH